jgi:glycosyltransferase involved in cell wall biosynthesis
MSVKGLNLLVVNWQDSKNPQAGGAELHLHEIFGRLVERGHQVTLLCSGWPGGASRDDVDGIHVHRVGGRHSFTFLALPYYRRHLRDVGFDLVVEDINKIPLYCPLWVRAPVVALVPHLFGATAFREATLPFATAVWLAERPVPHFYAATPFHVISESTASDLVERGVPEHNIRVIRPGIDHSRFHRDASVTPFAEPTFVYIGRLKRYKGLEVVIDALAELARSGVSARLIVAGKGDHEAALRRYADAQAPGLVEFRGFVSEDEKLTLLRKGWATVYPSPKEGWGLTNLEAAACGTPALASDSPGLRESVEDGCSGLLVDHGDSAAWVKALRRVAEDSDLRRRLREGALRFAGQFSWERTADETETHLLDVVQRGSIQSQTHHTTSTAMSEAT